MNLEVLPVTQDEFEAMVREAAEALPLWVRQEMEGTLEILVAPEPVPSEWPHILVSEFAANGGTWEIYGSYSGLPLPDRIRNPGPHPVSVIRLYKGPCLRANADVEALRFQVRNLVEHEVGHHFGLTEEEIGLAHQRKRAAERKHPGY